MTVATNNDLETLTITILDSASIFEGPETVYRYDLPGSGIVDGWALSAVLEQAEKICGPAWPEVDVDVIADSSGTAISDEAVDILRRQCAAAGATVLSPGQREAAEEPTVEVRSVHAPETPEASGAPEPEAESCRGRAVRHRASVLTSLRLPSWFDPFYAAIAAVVLTVAVVAWWAVGEKQESVATPAAVVDEPVITSQTAKPHSAPPRTGELKPGQKRIDVEGMAVVLPQGFQTSVDQGMVTATGEDPNLRILLAADPMFNVPAEALFAEIGAQIESDPALKDPSQEGGRLTYVEDPGDGSTVTWMTWEDSGKQMSVGCHTRYAPSVIQKAACRMAAESLVPAPEAGMAAEK